MKKAITLLLLSICITAIYGQNTSKYEAPQYLPERPYNGIIGKVDSMVTYTYDTKKIHRKNIHTTDSLLVRCTAISRFYFEKDGRHTLVEKQTIDNNGIPTLTFREVIQRDDESLPTSRTITQDGVTSHYILQSREDGTEVYKTARPKGNIPSIDTQMVMTVTYENEYAEFDMGDDHIETEMSTVVTTTIKHPSGLQTITIDDYSEEGFRFTNRVIQIDGAGNQIADSQDVSNEESIVSYTNSNEEDEYGNYTLSRFYNEKDILKYAEINIYYYTENWEAESAEME